MESGTSSDEEILGNSSGAKPKRWAWKATESYFANIMILTCCEIIESGHTMSMPGIHGKIMEAWHRRLLFAYINCCFNSIATPIPPPPLPPASPTRYFDVATYPKPHALQHPGELWKNSAFENADEYKAFVDQPMKLGRPTAGNPQGGMMQKYHDFAEKIWAKFKLVRREIAAETCVIWKSLVPNNHFPSGKGMLETLESLKFQMFEKWQVQPSSKKSKQVYCKIAMTGIYAQWRPIWWDTWKALGPPAGSKCSQVFMSECCGFPIVCDDHSQLLTGPLMNHFVSQAAASNVKALSRLDSQRKAKEEDRKNKEAHSFQNKAAQESKEVKHEARAQRAQAYLDLEIAKEKRKGRQEEIDRLVYLISRAEIIGANTSVLRNELDTIYASPIVIQMSSTPTGSASSSFSQRSGAQTPFSPLATPTDSSSSSFSQHSGAKTPFSPVAKIALTATQSPTATRAEAMKSAQEDALAAYEKAQAICAQKMQSQTETLSASPQPQARDLDAQHLQPVKPQLRILPIATSPCASMLQQQQFLVEDLDAEQLLPQLQFQPIATVSCASSSVSQQQKRAYRKLLNSVFSFETPPGGCLFECFVREFHDERLLYTKDDAEHEFDVTSLREMVADEFIRMNGLVPGHKYSGPAKDMKRTIAAMVRYLFESTTNIG
jgi:hypothetical protein